MRAPLSHVPLLPLTAGLIAGILTGRYTGGPNWLISVPATLFVIALIMRLRMVSVIAAGVTVGWLALALARPVPLDAKALDGDLCTGMVTDVSETASGTLRADVRLTAIEGCAIQPVKVRVSSRATSCEIWPGDTITFEGYWSRPVMERDLPHTDNLSGYYYNLGISALCYVAVDSISIDGHCDNLYYRLRDGARRMSDAIHDSGLSPEAAALVAAVITGDDDALSVDSRSRYSAAGIAHILALSGMHVAVIMLIVSVILSPLDLVRRRKTRLVITIAVIWIYACSTGLGPSVVRASIMASIYLTGRIIERQNNGFNSMCAAALMILVFSPMQLFMPGFQLSFAAVGGILLLAERLNPCDRSHSIAYRACEAVTVPVSAVAGTGVLSVYYFNRLAPLFIIANIPVALLMPPLFMMSLVMIVCVQTGYDAAWPRECVQWLFDAIDTIAGATASEEQSPLSNLYITSVQAAALYLLIAAAAIWGVRRRLIWGVATMAAVAVVCLTFITDRETTPGSHWYLTRGAQHTELVLIDGDTYYLMSTAPHAGRDDVAGAFEEANGDFIRRYGLSFRGLICGDERHQQFTVEGDRVTVDGQTLTFIDSMPSDTVCGHTDYALITRLFTGDITAAASVSGADTVLILREVNRTRARRYGQRLTESGIPFRVL